MRTAFLIFITVLLLGVGCKKDIPPVRPASGSITAGKRLLICNEGNFGQGNATISVYDPLTQTVIHDAYGMVNSNQYIGDVLQSVGYFNDKYYWVVNNSGKVVVTDKNFSRLVTIGGFISPRYIMFVSNNKAYITNLQLNNSLPNYIQVLDLATNVITKTIRLDGWTEQMVQSYGKVYVANQRKNYVYVINAVNDVVTDSIFLGATSGYLIKDRNEKVWVACNPNSVGNKPARLVRFDPVKDSIEADINLGTMQNAVSCLSINGNEDVIYYVLNDLYRMPVTSTTAGSLFIQQGTRTFYGLCVDPADETIYVSDAIDNNQDGTILRYLPTGSLHSTFKAGISPGFMRME